MPSGWQLESIISLVIPLFLPYEIGQAKLSFLYLICSGMRIFCELLLHLTHDTIMRGD